MRRQAKIQKWGNSLALRLSGPIKEVPQFVAEMVVDVNISERGIEVLRPVKKVKRNKLPFTEAQLLKGLTPYLAHADELAEISEREFFE